MNSGAEIRGLDLLVGRWQTSGELLDEQGAAAGTFSASDIYEWLPGGHFLVHRWDAAMPDGRSRGLEVFGHEAGRGVVARAYDESGGSSTMFASVEGRSVRLENEGVRFTGVLAADGARLAGDWERCDGGSEWRPWMRVRLARVVDPSGADGTNRSMPPGILVPELAYPDVLAAADWLVDTFGFRERLRIGDHRVQLVFGDAAIVALRSGPGTAPPAGHGVMVRVADVDGHHRRALARGATIRMPPTDFPYGERQYSVEDPGGHRWTFSQSVADVDPRSWGGELRESET